MNNKVVGLNEEDSEILDQIDQFYDALKSTFEIDRDFITELYTTYLKNIKTKAIFEKASKEHQKHIIEIASCLAEYSLTDGLKILLELGMPADSKDQYGDPLIFIAIAKGHLPTVQLLANEGHANLKETNIRGETPLRFATLHQHPKITAYLKTVTK